MGMYAASSLGATSLPPSITSFTHCVVSTGRVLPCRIASSSLMRTAASWSYANALNRVPTPGALVSVRPPRLCTWDGGGGGLGVAARDFYAAALNTNVPRHAPQRWWRTRHPACKR